jgi:Lrp/AsnC family transcriptional regulator, regulator for asnA, asnC and gidA
MSVRSDHGEKPALDDLNRKLVECLTLDPRMSYTDLAAALGVSRPTAASMLQRLVDRGTIQTVCQPDLKALGYSRSMLFLINVAPGCCSDVAKALGALEVVQYAAICAGPYDVMCWGAFKGEKEMVEFLSGKLGEIPGLMRCETLMCQEIRATRGPSGGNAIYPSGGSQASLDDLDVALVHELRKNGRETTTALAAHLKTSRQTVIRRMKRLLDEGIVKFQVTVNPLAMGYRELAFIGMKVSPAHITDVGDALLGVSNVRTVALSTGRYDLVAWVVFAGQEDLTNTLAGEIGMISGIQTIETLVNLGIVRARTATIDMGVH